ncbi:MAG TPA: ectonucleotide pyrophosphatase/phosphodiesterase [Methylomirabilota bacterium]|nr:ectonucleotide pyrophosphatase/phosphodiesterase [Methylomirabilota bacterium]
MSRLLVALLVAWALLASVAAAQAPAPLALLISIDGLRPDYVTAAERHGLKIPALRRFVTEGTYARVEGVIPTVTYPSHTTLVTGVAPARHGIYSNTMFDPLRGIGPATWYWYAEDIKVPTLWDAAARAGWTTANIQWPVTVGARVTWNIPDYWRSALDDPKIRRALSTPGLLAALEAELGAYPEALDAESDEARGRFAVRLLETKRPAFLTLHLLAVDHAQHETGPMSTETFAALERLDAVVARLRDTAERLAPGRALVAIVSDHGFVKTDTQVNLIAPLRAAGLFTVERGRVIDWKAMPWIAGGAVAIVLKDPADETTRARVREVLDKLAADPAHGVDRILDADALRARGAFPTAAFVVGLKPGWQAASMPLAPMIARGRGGDHGHLPDLPELHASFFLVGAGVPAGRDLGVVDMRDIAPTLARRLGLSLPSADGKALLP